MPKLAFISDVHSNWEALQAVLADIATQKVDRLICLGDIVGYGADPGLCLRQVRESCSVIIAGNHDQAVSGQTTSEYFNPHAKAAVHWTRERLDAEELEYLENLPEQYSEDHWVAVHANLADPMGWGYVLDEFDAGSSFARMRPGQVSCFIGHSHVPVLFEMGAFIRFYGHFETMKLNPKHKYIINVGSVGQPRDGIIHSAYTLYDTDTLTVTLRRVPYDLETASRKIREAGLPEFLADRLRWGR